VSSREQMLREIEQEFAVTAVHTGRRAPSAPVMAALREVPRHAFVPAEEADRAYANRPLPIGAGQTISQPFIVALMTDLLDLSGQERVLEIGTGCGYQTAILSRGAACVYSIEAVAELASSAAERLAALGYSNVEVHTGNGRHGSPEAAPFNRIMVTAAAERVPESLLEQLAPGGRMVIPVHARRGSQALQRVTKAQDGTVTDEDVLPLAFVPLTGN